MTGKVTWGPASLGWLGSVSGVADSLRVLVALFRPRQRSGYPCCSSGQSLTHDPAALLPKAPYTAFFPMLLSRPSMVTAVRAVSSAVVFPARCPGLGVGEDLEAEVVVVGARQLPKQPLAVAEEPVLAVGQSLLT